MSRWTGCDSCGIDFTTWRTIEAPKCPFCGGACKSPYGANEPLSDAEICLKDELEEDGIPYPGPTSPSMTLRRRDRNAD